MVRKPFTRQGADFFPKSLFCLLVAYRFFTSSIEANYGFDTVRQVMFSTPFTADFRTVFARNDSGNTQAISRKEGSLCPIKKTEFVITISRFPGKAQSATATSGKRSQLGNFLQEAEQSERLRKKSHAPREEKEDEAVTSLSHKILR